jgi:integrase
MRVAAGFAEYWYAWRGGPRILNVVATSERLRDIQVQAKAPDAVHSYAAAHADRRLPEKETIAQLVRDWKASPAFANLAERTRKDLARHLVVIEHDLGKGPIASLGRPGMRKALIDWRDRYRHIPRTADHYSTAFAWLLAWARNQGRTAADPMRDWRNIYRVNRTEVVWSAEEIEALCAHAESDLTLAILGAAYTGLRQGDLLSLKWSSLGDGIIVRKTAKKQTVAHIPITPALRTVLDACSHDSDFVFTLDGKPWTVTPLAKRFRAARAKVAKKLPGVATKRWHDFRGTFATHLVRSGASDADVDKIMGWTPGQSERTRASYVTGSVLAEKALSRVKTFYTDNAN